MTCLAWDRCPRDKTLLDGKPHHTGSSHFDLVVKNPWMRIMSDQLAPHKAPQFPNPSQSEFEPMAGCRDDGQGIIRILLLSSSSQNTQNTRSFLFPIKVVVEKPLANSWCIALKRKKTRQSAAVFSEILKTFTGNRVEILGVSDVSNQ